MGFLTDPNGLPCNLHPRHLVGRSRRVHTILSNLEASSHHATLTWTEAGWVLRDLGSRNGTFWRGELIKPGVDLPVAQGDVLAFGTPDAPYVLSDASEPKPVARCGDRLVVGERELLALPSLDEPRAVIQFESQGWVLQTDEATKPVTDGETIQLGGLPWVLGLPEATVSTVPVAAPTLLDTVGLDFRVSSDEEYVELSVRLPEKTVDLPPRAHHYLLFVLARARMEDASASTPESSHGWLHSLDLQRMVRLDRHRINLAFHRARREFQELGIADAKQVVERRPTSQQIRLGLPNLSMTTL